MLELLVLTPYISIYLETSHQKDPFVFVDIKFGFWKI